MVQKIQMERIKEEGKKMMKELSKDEIEFLEEIYRENFEKDFLNWINLMESTIID